MHSLCGPIKWMASLALYKQTLSATTANFAQQQQQPQQQELEHTRATVHGYYVSAKVVQNKCSISIK